jgi:hypothetical protein
LDDDRFLLSFFHHESHCPSPSKAKLQRTAGETHPARGHCLPDTSPGAIVVATPTPSCRCRQPRPHLLPPQVTIPTELLPADAPAPPFPLTGRPLHALAETCGCSYRLPHRAARLASESARSCISLSSFPFACTEFRPRFHSIPVPPLSVPARSCACFFPLACVQIPADFSPERQKESPRFGKILPFAALINSAPSDRPILVQLDPIRPCPAPGVGIGVSPSPIWSPDDRIRRFQWGSRSWNHIPGIPPLFDLISFPLRPLRWPAALLKCSLLARY